MNKPNSHVTEQGQCHALQAFKFIFQKQMLAWCPHSSQLLSFVFFFNKHMLNIYCNARVMVVSVNHHRGKTGGDYLDFLGSPLLNLFLNMPVRQHLYNTSFPLGITSFFHHFGVVFLSLSHPFVTNVFQCKM